MDTLSVGDLKDIFEDVPSSRVSRDELEGDGIGILELSSRTGITASNGEARRLIRQGGLFVNNSRSEDENRRLTTSDCIEGELIVIRKGKKTYHLVRIGEED